MRRFERYVAIGDSTVEGLDDPDGRGGHRGWANRLAERIAAPLASLQWLLPGKLRCEQESPELAAWGCPVHRFHRHIADRRLAVSATALEVRRDKAALSCGCKSHPATAPAGSNRSNYGGNEMVEAFG